MRDELFSGAGWVYDEAGSSYPFSLSTSVTSSLVLVGGEGFEDPGIPGLKDFEVAFLHLKRRASDARVLSSKRNLEV